MAGRFISLQISEGEAFEEGNLRLKPVSQAVILRFPFGGYVVNRPTAVKVVDSGKEYRIAIVDYTRVAQILILGISMLFWLLALRRSRRQ